MKILNYPWKNILIRLVLIVINVLELVLTFIPSQKVSLKKVIDKLEKITSNDTDLFKSK